MADALALRSCAPLRGSGQRRPRVRCAITRAAVRVAATADDTAALAARVSALVSFCVQGGASGGGLRVSPDGCGRGRGLVASRAIEAGEVLLQLPLSLGIADEPAGHPAAAPAAALARVPWFARLAARLLQERAAGDASPWAPYIAVLPERVDTPLLCDASLAELRQRYAPLADEANELRAQVAAAYADLAADAPAALAGASAAQFAEAVSVVHSRAYGMRAAAAGSDVPARGFFRVMLPLADMVNHGGDEAAEGADAPLWPPARDAANVRWDIEEVEEYDDVAEGDEQAQALAAEGAPPARRFYAMRVTALAALDVGEEALFSYREQSSDHFLLYYGFVPPRNPHEDVVLWASTDAALDWHAATYPAAWAGDRGARRAAALAAVAAVEARVASGSDGALAASEPRLKLLAGARLDGRLVAALSALHRQPDEVAPSDATLQAVHADVHKRCEALLAELGTAAEPRSGAHDPVADALEHKRRVLRDAMAALAPHAT